MQHLDEGTIHAWLDGALAPDESRRVEAHAASCDACSALVAEARGLIAASSRILTALDDVPGDVIPVREGQGVPVSDDLAAIRAKKAVAELSRRRRWWRQPRIAAAAGIVFVAAGTLLVMRQGMDLRSSVEMLERPVSVKSEPAAVPSVERPLEAAPAMDRVEQSRADAPAVGGGDSSAQRDGRFAKEEAASRGAALRRAETRAVDEPSRDLAAVPARSAAEARADSVAGAPMKQRVQSQIAGGQQANTQLPAAPAPTTQQQQTNPTSAERLATSPNKLVLTPPPSSASFADSASRQSRARDVAPEALRTRVNSENALAANLFAGCYQIRAATGARPASLVPQTVRLDTVVVVRGDTSWYRAQALDAQPVTELDLTWRPGRIAESGALGVEIVVRRGQSVETLTVRIERFAGLSGVVTTGASSTGGVVTSAKAADARAASPRPPAGASYTADQTTCPRR